MCEGCGDHESVFRIFWNDETDLCFCPDCVANEFTEEPETILRVEKL